MKHIIVPIGLILISFAAFAEEQKVPGVSSNCQIRSLGGQEDGSTVEWVWKITARTSKDRVLSVDHLTRNPTLGTRGVTRHLEYCKPGSRHEQEIILKVGQAPDAKERAFRFGGLVTDPSLDVALPESADVSVTTRQIDGGDEPGHLISIVVSNEDREIFRHLIFISFISPEELRRLLPRDLAEEEREPRDGNEWGIFTDPDSWKVTFERYLEWDN